MLNWQLFQKPQWRITLVYLVVALLWILFSDTLMLFFITDESLIPGVSILKGMGFVVVTAAILYTYMRREFNRRFQLETDLREQIERVRQLQQDQERGEARFRKAVEEAPLPMMIMAEDGEILTISQTWLDISGYTHEQLKTVGDWTERAYGDCKQSIEEGIDKLFDLETRVDEGEFVIRCADGSERIWNFSSTPLGHLPDNRRIVMSIASDVTARRQTENALKESEQFVNSVLRAVPNFIFIYDVIEDRHVFASEGIRAITGMSPEALTTADAGKMADLVHPDDLPMMQDRTKQMEQGDDGEQFSVVCRLRHEDGSWRRVQIQSVIFKRTDSGAVHQTVGSIVDISQITAMEQELRIKDIAIETSITPIALADLSGHLTYVNAAFVTLWKLDSDEQAVGRSVLEFWVSAEAAEQVVMDIAQNGTYVGELTALLHDGSTAEIELTASMVRDVNGVPVCMMGSFNDVTHRKQAAAFALENERLKAGFQKEQERNALVQRVISALSHDLRTPLTVISTSRAMLARYGDRLPEVSRQQKLDTIGRQVQFALELLDDTVNMARGNLTGAIFQPKPVNIAALCRVSVDEVCSANGTRHKITFEQQTDTGVVVLDEVLVSRILLNLLTNAIKYSPEGSEIRLELAYRDDQVVLRVTDQGRGIREDDLPHIFEPFYRADDVTDISGTGLGLSIVKDCADRHQGQVAVERNASGGSTFMVRLPVDSVGSSQQDVVVGR